MPSAWTQNFYHAVFSTKGRVELIDARLEERLYPFIGGILKDLGCTPYAINGMPDHTHLLARYPSNLAHSDLVRHVKFRSSTWIHQTFPDLQHFAWQEGYGGFTVSKSMVPQVEHYIARQKTRHMTQSYRDEALELVRINDVQISEEDLFG